MQWEQIDEMIHQSNDDMKEHVKYQMCVHLYQALAVSKRTLEYHRADDPTQVPQNSEAMEAWVMSLEGAVLLSELVMSFPDVADIITNQNEYEDVLNWALDFAVRTTFPDDDEVEMMNLAKIELGLVPKPPGYLNPLRVENQQSADKEEDAEKIKEKMRKEQENLPRDEM